MMPEQLRACEPCRQRPGRMGASVIAVDNGDIFGPQEAYLWPYVSKDAQYGACIDTHVKGRLGPVEGLFDLNPRSEEHTSELQSLMRISYAVFCLKKKKKQHL